MKSLSQLITRYRHIGLTQLVGSNKLSIERVIYSEIANFPLDDISIVVIRGEDENFCGDLSDGGVDFTSFPGFASEAVLPSEGAMVVSIDLSAGAQLTALYGALKQNERGVSSFILSPVVSKSIAPQVRDDIENVFNSSIVCVDDLPQDDNILRAEYAVLFRGASSEYLDHYGFRDPDDYSFVVSAEEEGSIRFFIVKQDSEPQLQIYPWSSMI
jgi:hypothetical protein